MREELIIKKAKEEFLNFDFLLSRHKYLHTSLDELTVSESVDISYQIHELLTGIAKYFIEF